MALATFALDPNAETLTANEHIDRINAATNDITRAGAVDPSARPIEAGEVGNTELAATAAKDNLVAMPDVDRGVVMTRPVATSGDFKVVALKRLTTGLLEVEYDDVAV